MPAGGAGVSVAGFVAFGVFAEATDFFGAAGFAAVGATTWMMFIMPRSSWLRMWQWKTKVPMSWPRKSMRTLTLGKGWAGLPSKLGTSTMSRYWPTMAGAGTSPLISKL